MPLISLSSPAPPVTTFVSKVSAPSGFCGALLKPLHRSSQGGWGSYLFHETDDTGIPALQEWCHHLTVSSRERAARNFFTHLKTFANSVKTYVEGAGDVTAADRESLRAKWESNLEDMMDLDEPMPYDGGWPGSDDPFSIEGLAMLCGSPCTGWSVRR